MIERAYFADTVVGFKARDDWSVLGELTLASEFDVNLPQRDAWQQEIQVLRHALRHIESGEVFLEFVVPRLGKRIDAVLLLHGVVVVLEFKIGATEFARADINQVWDYALDLKNFHETSHDKIIKPALVITGKAGVWKAGPERLEDAVADPALVCADRLGDFLTSLIATRVEERPAGTSWQAGRYRPTPTIIEAATSLYRRHSVKEMALCPLSSDGLTP